MDVEFKDDDVAELEIGPGDGGYSRGVTKAFRKTIGIIRAAPDERVFYKLQSLRFEKLKGARAHQYAMRLNDQWRLIVEMEGAAPHKVVVVVAIEDYH
jgi:proteic killer suppression protein